MVHPVPADAPTDTLAFPMQRVCPFDPPPQYARLRSEQPVSRVHTPGGSVAWLVTRHEDVRQVLSDSRMSSDRRKAGFPKLAPGQENLAKIKPSLIGMDAPKHTAARREVLGEFTVRKMQGLRTRIQEIVDECIDEMLKVTGPVDLVQALSLPVPSLVICELLGVPYADHEFFQHSTSKLIARSTSSEERTRCFETLRSYLGTLVSGKEREPGDDVLGRLVRKQRADGTADHEELVSMAFLLLLAGHETTANMISLSVLGFLENPDQLAAILADPAKTPMAVEELLRYFSIADGVTVRTAAEDIEIGGVLVRAGEGVIALGPAANRDPEVFDHADEIDIERGGRQHVAFGYGAHQCLGQNLARMELQIVFDTLFRRVPGLRLAVELADVPFKNDSSLYGVHELSVTW